ncbi:MAG: M20/M25/M40 family metallo-hydrolase [Bacilli bacterium]|nr:M20/M25/M40 family metallo-hydrolase [Sphaerochaetaceae bacterium]
MSTSLAEKALEIMLELIAIDSPTGHEENIRLDLIKRLDALSIVVETDTAGNLLGRLAATKGYEQTPALLINCHMDTVPNAVNVKPIVADGFVRSDGTTALGADDKAGLAVTLTALHTIQEEKLPHGPIVILFTVSEEVGLNGVKAFDTEKLGPIGRGYTLDDSGPVGSAILSAPYKSNATIIFHGKAAHAGSCPEKGISAISLAARAIDRMQLLRIDHETTANVGSIHGGKVNNIVCDCCKVRLEVRSASKEQVNAHLAHIESCCIKAVDDFGGSYDFNPQEIYPGYKIDEETPQLLAFKAICDKLNIPYAVRSSGGASDANILRNKGIPIIPLALGYEGAHTFEESIAIQELENITKLLITLCEPQ